jgi:hypothetical protein
MESVKVLKNEICSTKLEAEPSESVSDLARPFDSAAAKPSALPKDLNSKLFS